MPNSSNYRQCSPSPRRKKSLLGMRRKLSEMSSLQDPQLPIPEIIRQYAQNTVNVWSTFKAKILTFWDYVCVWCLSLIKLYHLTEDDRSKLLEWVRSKAPGCSVMDFSSSWKNGIALMALVENLVPIKPCVCPQYHLLNPKHSIQNAELAISIALEHLGISPLFSAVDVASGGSPSNERKLILYVIMLKMAAARKQLRVQTEQTQNTDTVNDPIFQCQPCLAKGMGLMLAVQGRKACVNIYLKQNDFMDIMIEIRGPGTDFASRRITNRSPRNTVDVRWPVRDDDSSEEQEHYQTSQMNIILEYEITGRKVSVCYVPKSSGNHQLSIFWQGYHIQGSPFVVRVDGSMEQSPERQLLGLPNIKGNEKLVSWNKDNGMKRMGKIIRRRLIRKVLIQNGKEIDITNENYSSPPNRESWFPALNTNRDQVPQVKPMARRKAVTRYKQHVVAQMSIDVDCAAEQTSRKSNTLELPTISEGNQSPTESVVAPMVSEFWKNLHHMNGKATNNLHGIKS